MNTRLMPLPMAAVVLADLGSAVLKGNSMAHWPDDRIQKLFNIKLPIIQAPIAGSSTTEMAIVVAVTGGLGSLPSAQMIRAELTEALNQFRTATSAPVNVNFFCHTPAGTDPLVDCQWRKRRKPTIRVRYRSRGAGDFRKSGPIRRRILLGSRGSQAGGGELPFRATQQSAINRVKRAGAKIILSATTVREAVWLEAHG